MKTKEASALPEKTGYTKYFQIAREGIFAAWLLKDFSGQTNEIMPSVPSRGGGLLREQVGFGSPNETVEDVTDLKILGRVIAWLPASRNSDSK